LATTDALLKNPVALKVLVWSRGLLVTPQILTTSGGEELLVLPLPWWNLLRRLMALPANVSPLP